MVLNKIVPCLALVFFAACGDDDSSFAPRDTDDDSSTSICNDCDDESSSSEKQGDGGSEAAMTSSSAKSSSSVKSSSSAKSSSSEKQGDGGSEAAMTSSSAKSSSSATSSNSATSIFSGDFDWSLPKETYFNPEIKYDSIVDARDGKVYKTVRIGNQTWMAENLNYADSAAMPSLKENSWCYLNDPKNCGVGGRLYTWALAKAACPDGWHVPDSTEWTTLFDFVGGQAKAGKILKSQEGWNNHGGGSDAYGFTALPVGHHISGDSFGYEGYEAALWSSTEAKSGRGGMFIVYLEDDKDSVVMVGNLTVYGYSVRCIKGEDAPISSSSSEDQSSSSEALSSSSSSVAFNWDWPKEAYFNPEIKYDSIIDARDGNAYRIINIGEQTWMAENLNYADTAAMPSLKENSWCFGFDAKNCELAGRFYAWNVALSVCPEGWHLPDTTEWRVLIDYLGGRYKASSVLKSQKGWNYSNRGDGNGTDSVGFCALPVGYKLISGETAADGNGAMFWSAIEEDEKKSYLVDLNYSLPLADLYSFSKNAGLSIRCLKD